MNAVLDHFHHIDHFQLPGIRLNSQDKSSMLGELTQVLHGENSLINAGVIEGRQRERMLSHYEIRGGDITQLVEGLTRVTVSTDHQLGRI